MKKLVFLVLILGLFLQLSAESPEGIRADYDALMDSHQYNKAEALLRAEIKGERDILSNYSLLRDLLFATGERDRWYSEVKALLQRKQNDEYILDKLLNGIIEWFGKEEEYSRISPVLSYMVRKRIKLNSNNRHNIFKMLSLEKDRSVFEHLLEELITDTSIPSFLRLDYIAFFPIERIPQYFKYFSDNDIFFKAYKLEYYFQNDKKAFKTAFNTAMFSGSQMKRIYAQYLFSAGGYSEVISLLDGTFNARIRDYASAKFMVDALLILEEYKKCAEFIMILHPSDRSMFVSFLHRTFTSKELYRQLYLIAASGDDLTFQDKVRVAYFSGEPAYFGAAAREWLTHSPQTFQAIAHAPGNIDRDAYYSLLVRTLLAQERLPLQIYIKIASYLESSGDRFGRELLLLTEKQLQHDSELLNRYSYYRLMFDRMSINEIHPDPLNKDIYYQYLLSMVSFYRKEYKKVGKLPRSFSDILMTARWYDTDGPSVDDLTELTYSRNVSPMMVLVRFLRVNRETDRDKIRQLCRNFCLAQYINIAPDIEINDEITLLIHILYYKNKDNDKCKALISEHGDKAKMLKSLLNEISESG
ncbi:hypothetical protein KAI78_04370 [bacterium]|nr:hypothetical protein [bacterium]